MKSVSLITKRNKWIIKPNSAWKPISSQNSAAKTSIPVGLAMYFYTSLSQNVACVTMKSDWMRKLKQATDIFVAKVKIQLHKDHIFLFFLLQ